MSDVAAVPSSHGNCLQPRLSRARGRDVAISSRFYIFEEGGALKRVPQRIHDALVFGEDAIPEYADTRQRVAQVLIENESGKPVRILDVQGSYWIFDKQGRIDKGLQSRLALAMEFAFSSPTNRKGKVVDLRPELKRKKFEEEHRWELTVEEVNRITADLWPTLADAKEVHTVKGKAPKRPPLTHEAKHAIAEIEAKLYSIGSELENLSEPALKGLAFEANRLARGSSESRRLWSAVALEADHQREIKARHRTGKGVFYAILHIWHHVSSREMREADTIEVKCQGKKAAVEAARRLLADNAHRFSGDVTIEAEVISELEWSPISDGEPEQEEESSEADSA
jgi:hypothetical protein